MGKEDEQIAELNRLVYDLVEGFRLCAIRIDSIKKTLLPDSLVAYEKHVADYEKRWEEMLAEKRATASQELLRQMLERHDGVEQ